MLVLQDEYLPKDKKKRRKLEGVIFENILYLLNESKDFIEHGNLLYPGDPYINDTGDKQRSNSTGWPYIEANAFFVSTILHFLLNQSFFSNVPEELNENRLKEIAGQAIDQILDQFIKEQGWSYATAKFEREIYFTWSVVETLVEVLDAAEEGKLDLLGPERLGKLRTQLGQVRGAMELYLFHRPGAEQFIFTPQIIRGNTRPIYNALHAFITLGILGTSYYMEMAQILITLVANSHLIASRPIFETNYLLKHDKVDIAKLEDRSILPLIVRAIATVFGEYRSEEFHDITEKARLRNPWSYLIMIDRIKELKKKRTSNQLWGPEAEYEIYYTERVIEALISCYYYVSGPDKPARDLGLPAFDIKQFEAFKEEGLRTMSLEG
jgi:hypothetical protein